MTSRTTDQMVEDDQDTPPGRGGLVIAALGVVFGDIGTSPVYTFRECFNPEPRLPHGAGGFIDLRLVCEANALVSAASLPPTYARQSTPLLTISRPREDGFCRGSLDTWFYDEYRWARATEMGRASHRLPPPRSLAAAYGATFSLPHEPAKVSNPPRADLRRRYQASDFKPLGQRQCRQKADPCASGGQLATP